MSHVTEGALHAYLDGALDEYPAAEAERIRGHLDGCAECANRLEQERQIRSDATAMLGLAAPEVEMPSLEELRAYVKATRLPRPTAAIRMYRMGWAASVVLALGAGWMVRDGQLQQAPSMELDFGEAPALVGLPSSDRDDSRLLQGRADVSADAASKAPALEEAVALTEVAANAAGAANETGAAMVDVVSTAEAPEELGVLGGQREATEEVAAAVEPAVIDVVTEASRLGGMAERLDIPGDLVGELPSPQAPPLALTAGGIVGRAALVEPESVDVQRVERRRAESFASVAAATGQGTAFPANRTATDDQLEVEADGAPALAVPGYEVLSVTNMGEGTTPDGVHVVQRLGDDDVLELFHLQVGVDPGIVPLPEDGRNEVREETDGAWIIIQGRLPQEELRTLLASLFPEG